MERKDVADLFNKWNQALRAGDADQVTACYAPDAVLLPTVSPRIRYNPVEIRDYFVHFLEKKPIGKIIEENVRIFDTIFPWRKPVSGKRFRPGSPLSIAKMPRAGGSSSTTHPFSPRLPYRLKTHDRNASRKPPFLRRGSTWALMFGFLNGNTFCVGLW